MIDILAVGLRRVNAAVALVVGSVATLPPRALSLLTSPCASSGTRSVDPMKSQATSWPVSRAGAFPTR